MVKRGDLFCPRCGARLGPPRPRWLAYLACFLGGIVALMLAGLIELLFFVGLQDLLALAVLAGLVEEPVKQIGVAAMAFRGSRSIRSPASGALGGALAGLGFGVIEGMFYTATLSRFYPLLEAAGMRALLVLLHVLLSALAGVGVYFGSSRKAGGMMRMFLLIALASGAHALWNYAAVSLFG